MDSNIALHSAVTERSPPSLTAFNQVFGFGWESSLSGLTERELTPSMLPNLKRINIPFVQRRGWRKERHMIAATRSGKLVSRGIALLGGTLLMTSLMSSPAAAVGADPSVPEPAAVRIGDWILDETARGVISFNSTTSVASFQQDGLLTYNGYQYTAWYREDKTVALSRRALPLGAWESFELPEKLDIDDSHNTPSLAVSPSDGRLHLAIGTHVGPVRYIRSVPGLASEPDSAVWAKQSFSRESSTLPGATGAPSTWTYPMFEVLDGQLLLVHRVGTSANGRSVMYRYNDTAAGTWTYLGQFTASGGSYNSGFGTSNSRNAYLHGFTANPVTGDIEISFSWREQGAAWCAGAATGNHDLGYARSPDGGLTWLNNSGERIGVRGSDFISINDDHVVRDIPINRALANQEAQAFDSSGRLHVVTSAIPEDIVADLGGCPTSYVNDRVTYSVPMHHWREADGTWRTLELPFPNGSMKRSDLAFDAYDTAYVVTPDARILAATAASEWTDWRMVFDGADVNPAAEVVLDRTRLLSEGVLSMIYQEAPVNNAPSAFRVADFSTDPNAVPVPKNTTPEALPVPVNVTTFWESASATSTSNALYPATNTIDGDTSTFWVSSRGPTPAQPEMLTLEMVDFATISEVSMLPRFADIGPREYRIEARRGSDWIELASVSRAAVSRAEVTPVPTTYTDAIRLVITAAWDRDFPVDNTRNVQIREVNVTVVPNVTASASSDKPQFPASLAVDGDPSTFWVSYGVNPGEGPQPDRPEVFTLDFGAERVIREVTMTPRRADIGPRDFIIEARVDDEWTVLREVSVAKTASSKSIEVPSVLATAVRLVITSAWDVDRSPEEARNVQIAELFLSSPDTTAPESISSALAYSTESSFDVSWQANDPAPDTRVVGVEVYVKGPGQESFSLAVTVPGGASGSTEVEATEGDGVYEFYSRAVDLAGFREEPPGVPDGTVFVDTVLPTLTTEIWNRELTAEAFDDGSGLDAIRYRIDDGEWLTYTGPIPLGADAQTVDVHALDKAGNMSDEQTWLVPAKWDFSGSLSTRPLADGGYQANAGRALPIEFTVGEVVSDPFIEGFPRSTEVSCDSLTPVGEPSSIVTLGESMESMESADDAYTTIVWQTDPEWANSCRILELALQDYSVYSFVVRF